jgi:hypothetical protein
MRISKTNKVAVTRLWPRVSRLASPVLLALLCLLLSTHDGSAQGNASTREKRPASSELTKLTSEKDEIRTARYKLFQEESTFHAQYFKPLDNIRKQLDAEEVDLFAECSGGKDLKSPQYSYCIPELNRFNRNVTYFNERLEDLKAKLFVQRQQFKTKNDDLDRREREVDRKIGLLPRTGSNR